MATRRAPLGTVKTQDALQVHNGTVAREERKTEQPKKKSVNFFSKLLRLIFSEEMGREGGRARWHPLRAVAACRRRRRRTGEVVVMGGAVLACLRSGQRMRVQNKMFAEKEWQPPAGRVWRRLRRRLF